MRGAWRWTWPLLVVAGAVLAPYLVYRLRPSRRLDLVVVDKTVPFRTWVEHRSLFWLLDHMALRRPDGRPYDPERDYVGAFPPAHPGSPPERTTELTAERARSADLLYLADTYGVYREDLSSGRARRAGLERSQKLYGGLTLAEAGAARAAAAAGVPLVVEFNTLGSPTGADARAVLEDVLGLRWTRWMGRYFPRLEDTAEVPEWLRRNHWREWRRPWEFHGPGFVLVQDDAHVEVLPVGSEAERLGLTLERAHPADPLVAAARDGTPYPYWFDVVEPQPGTEVLAFYQWHLTGAGVDRLRARGLPLRFPAVLRRRTAHYFAGDFADNPLEMTPVPFAGFLTLKRWVQGAKFAPSEDAFYWRFYVPLMARLLGTVAEERGAGTVPRSRSHDAG
jgi:hypothetical protein